MSLTDLEVEVRRLCVRPDEVLTLTGTVAEDVEALVRRIVDLNQWIKDDGHSLVDRIHRVTHSIQAGPGEMRYPLSEHGEVLDLATKVDMYIGRRYELLNQLTLMIVRALPRPAGDD